MLYSEKFKDMRPLKDEVGGICRGHEQGRCCICGAETRYFEINYEAYFCSEECLAEMDKGYNAMLAVAANKENTDDKDSSSFGLAF